MRYLCGYHVNPFFEMARTAQTSISFVLREPNASEPTPIVGLIWYNNERIKISTGFKVLPKHWSETKHRIKNVLEASEKDKINAFLGALEVAVAHIITDLKAQRLTISKEELKTLVYAWKNPKPVPIEHQTLLNYVQHYIDNSPSRLIKGRGNKAGRLISPNTVRRYQTTLNGLKEFSQVYSRQLSFENIDERFYEDFTLWLTKKGYASNNVSKYIENVKTFMHKALESRLHSNIEYKRFSNLREESENIYLNERELEVIYNLDLSKVPRLERVRDLFILASWTGLRFSDFSNLKSEHIRTDDKQNLYIELRQQKTGNRVRIPFMHSSTGEIYKKYNGKLPSGISNQKTNDYIKEICQMAELKDSILKHITKGGKQLIKTNDGWSATSSGVEKWKLVTTHTARRSFATNLFKRGMPTVLIIKYTGHKNESEFLKYIKMEAEETHDLARSFFQ